jgi:hypothetical protein
MPTAPQSILKKVTNHDSTLFPVLTREERNRETALHHARLIQQRKDTEAQILKSIEALLELPADPAADPAAPTPSDSAAFKSHLVNFQPSDYDAVVEERNIEDLCGYPLCSRPRQKQDSKARFRIIRQAKRGEELLVVPKEKLEQWCSDDCARRSMYIRVQLNEEPAWLRTWMGNEDIVLLNEAEDRKRTHSSIQQLSSHMEDMEIDSRRVLALERGEVSSYGQPSRDIVVRENHEQDTGGAHPPSLAALDMPDLAHLSIEGHTAKQRYHRDLEDGSMEDGQGDTDWNL